MLKLFKKSLNLKILEPPTYEESAIGGAQVRDSLEEHENPLDVDTYTPRYPVYKFDIIGVITASKQALAESSQTVNTETTDL